MELFGKAVFKAMGLEQRLRADSIPDDGDFEAPTDAVGCQVYVVQVNYWPFHTALQVDIDLNNDGEFSSNEFLTYEVANDDKGVAILLYNGAYPDEKVKQKVKAMFFRDNPQGIVDTLHKAATAYQRGYDVVENNCRDVCRRALEHLRLHYRDRSAESAEAVVKLVEIARDKDDVVPKTALSVINVATQGTASKVFAFCLETYAKGAQAGFSATAAKQWLFRVDVTTDQQSAHINK